MIAITNAAGLGLHLTPGQNLTIEQAAGWLADDELPGAFSYPIGFPLDDHNQRFLLHGYRPDHARPDMEVSVTVQLDGVLYRRCTLAYRVTDGMGDGFLKIDAGEVYEKIKKLSLLEAMPDRILLGDGLGKSLPVRMGEIARLDPGTFPLTFFPIRNGLFFETDLAGKLTGFVAQPYLNAYKNGQFLTDTSAVKGLPVVPQLYLAWVLERIYALAGYRIIGDWIGREETQRLTMLNLTAMAGVTGLVATLSGHSVVAGLCLPDLSVPDFLKAIRQRYGLVFNFNANDQTVSIRRFVDVLRKPTTQDLTRFQLTGYSIDAALNRGYRFQETPDGADELFRDQQAQPIKPPALVLGRGEQLVEMKVDAPQMIYEPSSAGTSTTAKWLVPTVRQAGNLLDETYKDSDRFVEKNSADGSLKRRNDVGLRILSYRGMQPDSTGALYPLATNGTRDGRQATIDGSEATTLVGRAGVYRTNLRAYYYFRDQTRRVVASLLLPTTVLAGLKLDEPVALALEGSVRRSYLPDKIQSDSPGTSGLVKIRLTMLTLPDGLELGRTGVPADADEPVVWIELIAVVRIDRTRYSGHSTDYREFTKLTVKCWANAQRTQPAVVNSLPVVLRFIRSDAFAGGIPGSTYTPTPYQETLRTYYLSGSSAVIEADFLSMNTYGSDGQFDQYYYEFALDPGDGYAILS